MHFLKLLLSIFTITSCSSTNPKLAMYWELSSSPIIKLDAIPYWIDIILIAFATTESNGAIIFPQNDINLLNGIQIAKSKNQTVSLSLFGAGSCGTSISHDNTFANPNFNPDIFANTLVSTVNFYNFTDINIDNECRSTIIQESTNKVISLQKIKQLLPNLLISFSAFSLVHNPNNWQNYLIAYQKLIPFIISTLWMTYNIDIDPVIASNWYASVNLTDISSLGVPLNSIFYGYCGVINGIGNGKECVYGHGPNSQQILKWAVDAKNQNSSGMFGWTIGSEIADLNYNMTAFNTIGISKQVADILHA